VVERDRAKTLSLSGTRKSSSNIQLTSSDSNNSKSQSSNISKDNERSNVDEDVIINDSADMENVNRDSSSFKKPFQSVDGDNNILNHSNDVCE
jgi:hypothetical protein